MCFMHIFQWETNLAIKEVAVHFSKLVTHTVTSTNCFQQLLHTCNWEQVLACWLQFIVLFCSFQTRCVFIFNPFGQDKKVMTLRTSVMLFARHEGGCMTEIGIYLSSLLGRFPILQISETCMVKDCQAWQIWASLMKVILTNLIMKVASYIDYFDEMICPCIEGLCF